MGDTPKTIRFGEFQVDPADRRLFGPRGEIHLGARAFDVLEALLGAEGRLVSKEQLFDSVWDGLAVSDAALFSVIHELRSALGDESRDGMIRAIYGKGYRLEADVVHAIGIVPSLGRNGPAAAPSAPMLAVLPFDDLSAEGNMRFFSDGISEEILSAVARGSDIRTIGKLSSFAYRGADKARAMRELPATHILDGSVRRTGNRVRITVHLFHVASEVTLWSESYEHDLEDLLDTQIAIAQMVATSFEQGFRPAPRSDVPPEIYDLYLRAKEVDGSPPNLQLRLALLERVTREAPGFAPGWGSLAEALGALRSDRPFAEWPRIIAEARRAIGSAFSIDAREPTALTAELKVLQPYGAFERSAELINALEPEIGNTPTYHTFHGVHLARVGCLKSALDALGTARELDAGNSRYEDFRSRCLYCSGRLHEARDALWSDLQAFPGNYFIAATLLICAALLGDRDLIYVLTDPARLERFPLGQMYHWPHIARIEIESDEEAKRKFGKAIQARFASTGCFDLTSAVLLARYLSPSKCYDLIDRLPIAPAGEARVDSDFASTSTLVLFVVSFPEIRRDWRFARLCARLGLAQFWARHDVWPDCADDEVFDYDFRAKMRETARAVSIDPPLLSGV